MAGITRKKNYISILNVLSAFGVVALHVNAFWIYSEGKNWITSCITESVFYFAVPVFYMIAGVTLMDFRKRMNTSEYLKKRFLRAVVPYLFWMSAGILFHFAFIEPGVLPDFNQYVGMIFNPPYWSYFWFFQGLFFIYASILLLSWIPDEKRIPALFILALVIFGCTTAFPWLCLQMDVSWPWQLPVSIFGPVMYACLGAVLANWKPRPIQFWLLTAAGTGALLYFMTGTMISSLKASAVVQVGRGYYNWPCILYSSAVFLLVKQLCQKVPLPLEALQKYTFGIYLMQNMVISWIIKYQYDWILNWKIRPVTVVTVFLGLLAITWLVKKIPVLKSLV